MAASNNSLITGLDHINLQVPPSTLHHAHSFYANCLGLHSIPVPPSSKAHLAWFLIGNSDQTIHVSSQYALTQTQLKCQTESPRHPCFKVPSETALRLLQARVWREYERGGEGAPVYCDEPGKENRASQGPEGEFPARFFARDYAGNRLEFTT